MDEQTAIFEQQRTHLRAVAYRMLGSIPEADDAVQETWLRLHRSDVSAVDNLPAWLTTVLSRICLDQLRARTARREDGYAEPDDLAVGAGAWSATSVLPGGAGSAASGTHDPASEAEQADAVGQALMVVLDTLAPAERLAFCLHDLFGLSFDEVGTALGRSSVACRQLASRARRRVRGRQESVEADRVRQREVVAAFMEASREGQFELLLALLHPDAVLSSDAAAAAMDSPALLTGRDAVAQLMNGKARAALLTELDGFAAAMWMLRGEVKVVFAFSVEDGLVRQIELLAEDPERLDLAVRSRSRRP